MMALKSLEQESTIDHDIVQGKGRGLSDEQ